MSGAFTFWKMAGGGNDFILVDGAGLPGDAFPPEKVRRLCMRGVSIGADGLIVVSSSHRAGARMLHWNADGGANDFCGNGARCAARFAHETGRCPKAMTLETGAGVLEAEILTGGRVRVEVPEPSWLDRSRSLDARQRRWTGGLLRVGVPHFVTEVEDLDRLDVASAGEALRRHPELGAEGANVNFVRLDERGRLGIRTFERGVEAETLSCGSGSVAAAVWLRERTGGADPVVLLPRSGIETTVRLETRAGRPARFWLEGDARVVCRAVATEEADSGFPA